MKCSLLKTLSNGRQNLEFYANLIKIVLIISRNYWLYSNKISILSRSWIENVVFFGDCAICCYSFGVPILVVLHNNHSL